MRHFKRGGKPDRNQAPLIRLARRLHMSVQIVTEVRGFVDAVVGCNGQIELWEFKVRTPAPMTRSGRPRKLTDTEQRQADFRKNWRGKPPRLVTTGAQVVKALLEMESTPRVSDNLKAALLQLQDVTPATDGWFGRLVDVLADRVPEAEATASLAGF